MNRASRSHAVSPAKSQLQDAMIRSRSTHVLPREPTLPPTTVLVPFQDFPKSRDKDSLTRTQAKIGKSMLMKASSTTALPGLPAESSILKQQIAKYQFKTPPRSRKRPVHLASSVTDVLQFIRNPPKLHDSFLRPKLPKLDYSTKSHLRDSSFERIAAPTGSETEPVTARHEPTPERVLSKLRPVKAGRTPLQGAEGTLPAVVDTFRLRTRMGVMYGKPKKFNQDATLALQDFASTKNQYYFAVFDGHGTLGHEVAGFVKRVLPLYIDNALPRYCKCHSVRTQYHQLTGEDQQRVRNALFQAHMAVAEDLAAQRIIDVVFSGTTAVSVLIRGRLVLCSNVGDSRAVVGRLTPDGWLAIPLSNDHKPNDPEEQARIEQNNGRVEPYTGVRSIQTPQVVSSVLTEYG